MDVATHLLVPYAAALAALGFAARGAPGDPRRAALAAVFGVAGAAPDLDGLFDPLSEHFDALYWLQHRGVSHTLVGAPLFGLLLAGTLSLLARRHPRHLALFSWRAGFVPAAVLGALTHLVLDAVTYSGVPLWWPFADGRVSLQLFHWLVPWLFPVSLVVLLMHAFGRLTRRRVVAAGALVVALLVVVAGVRAWSYPRDLAEDALVYPSPNDLEWTVLRELPNGTWEAFTWRLGERFDVAWFASDVPPEAEAAVGRARETGAYKGFVMGSFGPVVVQAARVAPDDAWNVTFVDVAQRYEATHDPRWTPTEPFDAWGYVAFRVHDAGRIDVAHRGW